MEKDKDILKQVGRDTGMRVPDGYFEGFTSRMVSQLDNFEVVELEKPTVWQRVRPWLYMAAMFAGIWCMMKVFTMMKETSSSTSLYNSTIAEAFKNDDFVDDYVLTSDFNEYELIQEMYEDSINFNFEDTVSVMY